MNNYASPEDVKNILRIIILKRDKAGLWLWIKEFLDLEIPRQSICKDHDAPFDFVSDYIFGLYDFMVVLANRSGGKTLDFGILDTIISWLQEGTEVATVGAIQSQAQKCYEYFKDFSNRFPFGSNVISRTMKRTLMANKSQVQVLTGTMSGVNSPHPQLVFLDEIDLMNWQVMQQALSMAQSKKGVNSRTVLTSTRKFAGGVMQRMMNEATERGAHVYQWCIWEVVEKLPSDPDKLAEIKKILGEELPQGLERGEGYYKWTDLLTKFNTLDREVWETEWLCRRPGLEGIVYGSSYSDEENLIMDRWSPPKGGYIYLAEDFGYGEGHPDVVLFCWLPDSFDRIVVFDELYMNLMGDDDIWQAIDNKLQSYGQRLPDRLRKGGTVTGWACDYHGLTEMEFRRRRGAPILEKHPEAARYLVLNGIALVRKLFQSGRLMLTSNCTNLRIELLSYKKKKNLDGSYSKEPEKKMDHGPDAIRYLITKVFDAISKRAFVPRSTEEVDVSKRIVPITEYMPPAPTNTLSPTYINPDTPLTADLTNVRF